MDEVGDAPLDLQVKLLRVLQEGSIRRVGGNEEVPIDVRIIAATNIQLEAKVRDGSFRQDLYYRLNILPLQTMPLRNRKEDILPLIHHYLNVHANEEIYHVNEYIDREAIDYLNNHPWPGNVRELINVVEYIVNMKFTSHKISMGDLPQYLREEGKRKETIHVTPPPLLSEENEVLLIIYRKFGIGRRKIVEELASKDITMGEGKVKSILDQLRKKRLIQVNKGIRGCMITDKGKEEVKNIYSGVL